MDKHNIYYKQERGQNPWLENTEAWAPKAKDYIITKKGRFPWSSRASTTTTFAKSPGISYGSTSPDLSNDTKNAQMAVIDNDLVQKLHLMNVVFKGVSPSRIKTSIQILNLSLQSFVLILQWGLFRGNRSNLLTKSFL